jgi:hypothetical protein
MPELESYDDGAFVVFKTRWNTYASRDKDGNNLCSSLDKDATVFWSREHLNGFANSYMTETRAVITSDSLK